MNSLIRLSLIVAFCLLISNLSYAAQSCTSPQVTSKVYSTSEAQMSMETVVIVDFTLQCKESPKDLNLYAEFNGRTLPASQSVDGTSYQVSFSAEHKKLPSGHYTVRFFDDNLYSELRKAQRNGEDTSSVKTLFVVDFHHQGASHGPWIQTEHLAAAIAALVCYLAYSARSHLQS